MSCDNNTHKVTVLGDFEHNYKGRHWRDEEPYDSRNWDYFKALNDGEAYRDLLREVLESKFQVVKEVVEARSETKEAKFDVVKEILEAKAEAERTAREQLRDLINICRRERSGCHGD